MAGMHELFDDLDADDDQNFEQQELRQNSAATERNTGSLRSAASTRVALDVSEADLAKTTF